MIRPDPCLPRVHHDHGLAVHPPLDRHHPRGGDKALGRPVVGRHLHVQDLRSLTARTACVRQPKQWERKERFHPVA